MNITSCLPIVGTLSYGPQPNKTILQNYETITNYLPASVWDQLKDGVTEGLIDFAAGLGLRSPTEPTSQVLALAILFQSEGLEGTLQMSPDSKLTVNNTLKSICQQTVSKHSRPVACVLGCIIAEHTG